MCYSQFSNETELVRNMMGLIGNIAEVETLRYQLMNVNYINIFVYYFFLYVEFLTNLKNILGVF